MVGQHRSSSCFGLTQYPLLVLVMILTILFIPGQECILMVIFRGLTLSKEVEGVCGGWCWTHGNGDDDRDTGFCRDINIMGHSAKKIEVVPVLHHWILSFPYKKMMTSY